MTFCFAVAGIVTAVIQNSLLSSMYALLSSGVFLVAFMGGIIKRVSSEIDPRDERIDALERQIDILKGMLIDSEKEKMQQHGTSSSPKEKSIGLPVNLGKR
jgi:Tfp pilus assembly protein PilN